jgi:KDO2-lipid IV(A) lauroyltransferase
MQNILEYIVFISFVKLTHLLGWNGTKKLALLLGDFFYFFIPIREKVVIKNLKTAFPEKSDEEIKEITRKTYRGFALTFLESFLFAKMSKEEILSKVNVVNGELLTEVGNAGKGGILLTAHISNWELAALTVGLLLNKGIAVLTKPQRNPYVSKWYDKMRSSKGNKIISVGEGTKALVKVLLEGGIVGIIGDQRAPKENERVLVFNQPTSLYFGTASIAFKTKAPVLLVLMGRREDGNYDIFFKRLEYSDILGKENAGVIFNQRYMNEIEKFVRRFPEQWFWMHDIWKY